MDINTIRKALKNVIVSTTTAKKISKDGIKEVTRNFDYLSIQNMIEFDSIKIIGFGFPVRVLPSSVSRANELKKVETLANKYIKMFLLDLNLPFNIINSLSQEQIDVIGLYYIYSPESFNERITIQFIKNSNLYKTIRREDYANIGRLLSSDISRSSDSNELKEYKIQLTEFRGDLAIRFKKTKDKKKFQISL
jgi:hypothetical protein